MVVLSDRGRRWREGDGGGARLANVVCISVVAYCRPSHPYVKYRDGARRGWGEGRGRKRKGGREGEGEEGGDAGRDESAERAWRAGRG